VSWIPDRIVTWAQWEDKLRIYVPVEALIGFLIIGVVIGFLAERIMGRRGDGRIIHLVTGVIGAFIGGFLFIFLSLSFHGIIGPLIGATVGAVALLFLFGLTRTWIFPRKSGWRRLKNWSRVIGRR
jgi:uncharacterized membrane protein YeaQ/YmgE (transglycosylase-associated protein family)